MFHLLVLFLSLFAIWVVLSGILTTPFLILGVCVCLAVTVIYKFIYRNEIKEVLVIGFRAIKYFIWLVKEIAKASMEISLRMWQLEPEIYPSTEWVETGLTNEIAITIFANSITLTPGTVTIGTKGTSLHVHSLTGCGVPELEKGGMLERIKQVTKIKKAKV